MSRKPPNPIPESDPDATARPARGGRRPARAQAGQIGKYLLSRQLGQGAMGIVYEAIDTVLERRVALKLLPEAVAGDKLACERLLAEARAVARLTHPEVVVLFDAGQAPEGFFLAMELLDGGTLQDQLTRHGAMAWEKVVRISIRMCRALAAAHAAGLVHRDIKPSNILCTRAGQVKLSDFGLALVACDQTGLVTQGGRGAGTPAYMSPEQCMGERLGPASDLYALGATMYALLTGQPPFPGLDVIETMNAHCSTPSPDPRKLVPGIPETVAAVVMRAMAKSPEARFPSAEAMMRALEQKRSDRTEPVSQPLPRTRQAHERTRTLPPPPRPSRRRSWTLRIGLVAGAALLGGLTALLLFSALKAPQEPDTQSPSSNTKPDDPSPSSTEFRVVRTLQAGGEVVCLAGSPGEDDTMAWGTANGLFRIAGPDGKLRVDEKRDFRSDAVAISLDGLALWCRVNTLRFWDSRTGNPDNRLDTRTEPGGGIVAVALHPTERYVAIAPRPDLDGVAPVLRYPPTGKALKGPKGHKKGSKDFEPYGRPEEPVNTIAFSIDGRWLITGHASGQFRWRRADFGKEFIPQPIPGGDCDCFIPLPGEGEIAVASGPKISVLHRDRGELFHTPPLPTGRIFALAAAPDGKVLAAASRDQVAFFDVVARRWLPPGLGHQGVVKAVAFVGPRRVASGGSDGVIRVWELPGP